MKAEKEMRLPRTTPYVVHTDNAEGIPKYLLESGKLRLPPSSGRVHVDRSDIAPAVEGFQGAFAEWFLVSQAKAVVLSRSYFGETAAEMGRVRHAYFVSGCVQTDLSSS